MPGPRNITAMRSIRRRHHSAAALTLVTALLLSGVFSPYARPLLAEEPEAADTVDFNRDVRPILSDKCFKFHGPDAGARKAKLRLDLAEGARSVSNADRPQRSELLLRISHSDPDERMPPPDSKLALSADEIETLRRWVLQGAIYKRHWSFLPLRAVAVPRKESTWPKTNSMPSS